MAINNNGEPKPDPLGTDAHDNSFEGSTSAYAEHLIKDHGYTEEDVAPFKEGRSQSDWLALDRLHRVARYLEQSDSKALLPDDEG